MALSEVSAAVLIGGRSRRMGEPKALLRLDSQGPVLLELVCNAVATVASDVFLVGSHSWPLPDALGKMRTAQDACNGAVDGIVTALRAARNDACVVVGCDMPFLDSRLLREMVALAQTEGRGVVARDRAGLHPLHAVYQRRDLARIETLVGQGVRSLVAIALEIGMREVDVDGEGRTPGEHWSVFNVNTPRDLRAARERHHVTGTA